MLSVYWYPDQSEMPPPPPVSELVSRRELAYSFGRVASFFCSGPAAAAAGCFSLSSP